MDYDHVKFGPLLNYCRYWYRFYFFLLSGIGVAVIYKLHFTLINCLITTLWLTSCICQCLSLVWHDIYFYAMLWNQDVYNVGYQFGIVGYFLILIIIVFIWMI